MGIDLIDSSTGVRTRPLVDRRVNHSLLLSLAVGAVVLAAYLGLLPLIERTWRATGDEPHYLLAAHSLVTDGDFDLSNNYAQLDYLAFYLSPDIVPQVRRHPSGQQILDHHLGLPLLIAPAYALGGRYGVLVFQAIIGAMLAVVTFRLAAIISGDESAAVVATLVVALSPLLLFYPFLIYPELIGALLTTAVLYAIISQDRPTAAAITIVILGLLLLPWLNRRFVLLAFGLAGLIVWTWRKSGRLAGFITTPNLAVLATVTISTLALLWFNRQLAVPTRIDITVPASGGLIWLRLLRGIGWLLDQQRGLLIFAPIYTVALSGLPLLLSDSWRRRNRHWFVLMPVSLAWGVTAAAGGFWIAWELGPRFLVVALPALAPLVALAWQRYCRNWLWLGAALLLFALSLVNGLIIIANPELPYKSSLPLYYGQTLGLPLTEWLPDLAGYAFIGAAGADPDRVSVVLDGGTPVWFAPSGRTGDLLPPTTLPEVPFGHYRLAWPVRVTPNLRSDTEILRLSAKFLGGGPLFNRTVTAAELPSDGSYGLVTHQFLNTNVDRWRTPLVLSAVSSGQSEVWAADLRLVPRPLYAVILPYVVLLVLIGGAGWHWWRTTSSPVGDSERGSRSIPAIALAGIAAGLLLASTGYLVYHHNQARRVYDAGNLRHFVGRPLADDAAEDGRAWLVDPAVDPPQKAIYGPFDIFDPGVYRVTYRLKMLEAVAVDQVVASLQVNATDTFQELVSQPLHPKHFSGSDSYHHFVLTVTNPRRQALSFDLNYTGLVALASDGVKIEQVEP